MKKIIHSVPSIKIRTERSPRQVARAIGVSESSLKRWCDQGLVPSRRTAGGHRRIPVAGVVRFLRDRGYDIEHPELLGLPARIGTSDRDLADVRDCFLDALRTGDSDLIHRLMLGLYVERRPLFEIFDRMVAPAFQQIGHEWQSGELAIYREHRATELALRALHALGQLLPPPTDNASHALAATLEGDLYRLAITMCELVLRDAGWRAQSLGPDHPTDTLIAAISDLSPGLLVLSVNHVADTRRFLADYGRLYEHAHRHRVPVVVGGQALTRELQASMRYATLGRSMKELIDFADALWRAGS